MKLLITIHPAVEPPAHSRPVIGLDTVEGRAYPCAFSTDYGWITPAGDPRYLAMWFDVPSVTALQNDMMLTAIAEAEYEDRGAA